MTVNHAQTKYGTAVGRWAGLGPYYAMFPVRFAFEVIQEYSTEGQGVLDPFAGRGSSVFAAAALGRRGLGIEINSVGWVYSQAKFRPAQMGSVLGRISEIAVLAAQIPDADIQRQSEFFRYCYHRDVLSFLLAARANLQWRTRIVDATLAAIILVYLHGKRTASLSNQMMQSKAMAPDYSVQWWKEKKSDPPEVDVKEFLGQRVRWRYAKGAPAISDLATIWKGDSTKLLRRLNGRVQRRPTQGYDLLFTSPPYFNVTNYHYDQWLRLWLLGGPDHPTPSTNAWEGRFASAVGYKQLLDTVFAGCANVMNDNSTVYVRTDAREFTYETTLCALSAAFPRHRLTRIDRPVKGKTQTALYGDASEKPGEVDLILKSRGRVQT